ncbi:MAG: hypothetical protein J1F66_00965 [Clostridiales bacterium]|nr:hypothetical protein [Clostridiales bacterium]
MRKITEKIAIVAQICITLIFVVTTLLYITGVIPYNEGIIDNGVFVTLLIILAITYGLLSAYIIYVNFSEYEALRQVLLFCDSESSTRANVKVVRNIVRSCDKKVNNIRVRRVKMRLDEKQGFVITLKVDVAGNELSVAIDKLRCLIADSFKNTLNLTFNSINFEIRRLKSRYTPNVERAEKLAKTLSEQRELSADIYEQPFQDNCEECEKSDGESTESEENGTETDEK